MLNYFKKNAQYKMGFPSLTVKSKFVPIQLSWKISHGTNFSTHFKHLALNQIISKIRNLGCRPGF